MGDVLSSSAGLRGNGEWRMVECSTFGKHGPCQTPFLHDEDESHQGEISADSLIS